ncbi:hypothetical protein Taro_022292 [Colocasia esculenta]|uniref:Uncharacterized protein n=1 Tax=Colocasia esculenta TaxID=4460 RepID=A0A843UU06_COLES|nr:hypothetical protein [Colocasia esculenta]
MDVLQGRGVTRLLGGGSWIAGARRWRVASLREGPLRLDLHLEVRLHSSSLRGVARRRAHNRSVSPSGSPDPWAAVPTVGSLVGAEDPGAGAVTVMNMRNRKMKGPGTSDDLLNCIRPHIVTGRAGLLTVHSHYSKFIAQINMRTSSKLSHKIKTTKMN